MSLKCGIVGLPNVGKSTLFNALTSSQNAEASNYPFCTIDPNIGSAIVPDNRVKELVNLYNPAKVIPSVIEFVDIAGLVKGASKGEGLGNQFLSHIREVDAIIHIVRCFDDSNIVHVEGEVNPENDIETIETELILKDFETIEKRSERVQKLLKANDKNAKIEFELLEKIKSHLDGGRLVKYLTMNLNDNEKFIIERLHLLTNKPVLYVCNVDESSLGGNEYTETVKRISEKEGANYMILSVQIESEIAQLDSETDKTEFLQSMGLQESGLNRPIKEAFKLLDLITFFTAGEKEVHAWTIIKNSTAPQAAGKIHTDFEKGFIRAEIMQYDDLIRLKNESAVKEKGLLKIEGKDYIIQDGDVVHFRFNV